MTDTKSVNVVRDAHPDAKKLQDARTVAIDAVRHLSDIGGRAQDVLTAKARAGNDEHYAKNYTNILIIFWRLLRGEFEKLDELFQAGQVSILPYQFYFDRHSSGPVILNGRTYSNAHVAIHDLVFKLRSYWLIEYLRFIDEKDPHIIDVDSAVAERHAQVIQQTLAGFLGETFNENLGKWTTLIRLESAATVANLPPPTGNLSGVEQIVVDTLRQVGKQMTQEQLLAAAKLKITGSHKSVLAGLVERGVLINHGKGYKLPEWD